MRDVYSQTILIENNNTKVSPFLTSCHKRKQKDSINNFFGNFSGGYAST